MKLNHLSSASRFRIVTPSVYGDDGADDGGSSTSNELRTIC